MSTFVKTRDSALNAIKRYMTKSKDDAFILDVDNVESYSTLLIEQWARFNIAQDAVEESCGADNIEVEENARIQAETWYCTALANFRRVQKCRAESVSQPISSQATVAASIRLPKMDLPTFAGDSTEWIAFYDAFCSLVDNNAALSGGQKLYYLRSCLKGDALSIISGFKISDANYTEAWNLLKSRYKVMRVIVEAHLRAIGEIKKVTNDSADGIKSVLNAFLQHIRELKALGRPVDFWDDWLVHEIVNKLAFETRKQWELSLVSDEPPTLDQLTSFLEIRCRSLAMLTAPDTQASVGKVTPVKSPGKSTKVLHAISEQANTQCLYCKASHRIYSCEKFRTLDSAAKSKFLKESKACLNCLSPGHYKDRCNSTSTCRICHQRHHTLLHGIGVSTASTASAHYVAEANRTAPSAIIDTTSSTSPASHLVNPPSNSAATSVSSCLRSEADPLPIRQHTVLLSTASVKVRDSSDRWQTARLLFDSGSHATFVTEACVQRLGLPRTSSFVVVTGIGSSQGGRCKGETSLLLSSSFSDDRYAIDALILPKITGDLPSQTLDIPEWPHIRGLVLADPQFMKPGRVDILVGMDVMGRLICTELRKGPPGTPIAQKTVFGWTLCGNVDTSPSSSQVQTLHCDVHIDRALTRLWELEESPRKQHLTYEERFCEDHFASTHRRSPDGRFLVELPLKVDVPLGDSRDLAVRSLLRIERRMARDNNLQVHYNEFMQELLEMGHMEAVTSETNNAVYYMPHHAVLKESSLTTKLRVVFNASAKTSSGNSLNDALFVGPQLQQDLYSILLRFRTHRYAATADVAKMYRQVCVSSKHFDLQRIVWRTDSSSPIQDYRMLRVTYGVAAASHLAVKSLQQTAKDSSNSCEKSRSVILNDFYMDDLLTGASCKTHLQSLHRNVSEILKEGGFELRKWATNCKELKESISESAGSISHYIVDGKEVHALGLTWDTEEDHFTFAVDLKAEPTRLTKRSFLADASTLFDPLGLLAPVTIKWKMWFQDVWRSSVGWDDTIPDLIGKAWLDHRFQLQKLRELKVARWLGAGATGSFTELHVFADASESAYAAVIYARTLQYDGTVTVSVISSKTKVAPLKTTTLPRLELCAAHLASKLVRSVLNSWSDLRYPLYAWTDSTITLAWLQAHPSRWVTFIANRVADIQEILPPECWNHVRSELNPADCASRGMSPSDLLGHELWWNGPDFLQSNDQFWKNNSLKQHTTDVGVRNKVAAHVMNSDEHWPVIMKYSSFSKLRRVIAYVLRFIANTRSSIKSLAEKRCDALSSLELIESERCLIKYSQAFHFANEISLCTAKRPIPLRSSLLRLQPFLDPNGILRVGGRLKSAEVANDVRHPIILPKNSPLSRLIISDIHRFTLHAGPRIMQVVLQRRYWIIGARSLIRSIYHKCVKCTCINRNAAKQSMGDLPASRTTYARCFTRTAVDFAGPYSYKFTHGGGAKSTKGYICSFICMCTGAMHLEFVGDLSTPAFLNAFKRFINRRGYCKTMFSDNGTNFVGAEKELRIMYEKCMADDTLQTFFADSHIEWRFNPPTAPHMGGYWETGIKRIKYHLKRVLGETLLSYEEFSTLLTEVEACVNSRPLCEVSTNALDLEALTPGHFIIGEPLKSIPEPEGQGFRGNLHQRWQIISNLRRHFWRRWRDEYLLSLQRRTKWFRPSHNFEEGDVVAVINEATPPTKWTLARVVRCHPGADGRVRVVTVKTPNGEYIRPIAKLCLLPTKGDLFCEDEQP